MAGEKLTKGREAIIEEMCRAFVTEADGIFPQETWPLDPDDDGLRSAPADAEHAYVRLLSDQDQYEIRCAMGFAFEVARAALLQHEGREHG